MVTATKSNLAYGIKKYERKQLVPQLHRLPGLGLMNGVACSKAQLGLFAHLAYKFSTGSMVECLSNFFHLPTYAGQVNKPIAN